MWKCAFVDGMRNQFSSLAQSQEEVENQKKMRADIEKAKRKVEGELKVRTVMGR